MTILNVLVKLCSHDSREHNFSSRFWYFTFHRVFNASCCAIILHNFKTIHTGFWMRSTAFTDFKACRHRQLYNILSLFLLADRKIKKFWAIDHKGYENIQPELNKDFWRPPSRQQFKTIEDLCHCCCERKWFKCQQFKELNLAMP